MSAMDRLGCSLIPGIVVKLSRILAGPMVLSAVGHALRMMAQGDAGGFNV